MIHSNRICYYLTVCTVFFLMEVTLSKASPQTVCGNTLKIPRGYHRAQPGLQNRNGDIHNRSLSAWTWTINHEENRIPKTITEAVCSFTYCINPKTNPDQIELDEKLISVPIHQTVLVLNLVKPLNGYQASFISISVGCICVKRRIS
uniref:Interleukin-17A-like n=1 Tax=Scleropages formosus TaxID=113540 RepID=A0A8C9S5K6_SCLFO